MNTIIYQYWFLQNEDIPFTSKYKFYKFFSDAYHIYYASKAELVSSGLMSESAAEVFVEKRGKCDIQKIYENFTRSPFEFITIENDAYPYNLSGIFDPPYGFYYIGKLPEFSNSVSIVGARQCSSYGKKVAYELGKALGESGITVISGMARGIDTCAHRGTLDASGKTVAVLGSGVDVVYPRENRLLYEDIAKSGAIISEFPPSTTPLACNFPIRNRIVAGLSNTVVVVEAKIKSGSLITADLALDQGKNIYVVPGRITDKLSEGTNKLASQGASTIFSIDKFLEEIGAQTQSNSNLLKDKAAVRELSKEQLRVYRMFDLYPKSLNEVLAESGLDYLKIMSIIITLVDKGLLTEVFKNQYIISV